MTEDVSSLEQKIILAESEVVGLLPIDIGRIVHRNISLRAENKEFLEGTPSKPYEGGKYTIVDSEVEQAISPKSYGNSTTFKHEPQNLLASPVLYGMFQEIGYVDMTLQNGKPTLVGFVHVPRALIPLVEAVKQLKDEDIADFYREFCKDKGGNWRGHTWDFKAHPSEVKIEPDLGLPFIKSRYYWKIEKSPSSTFDDGRPLEDQVSDYITTIKQFMTAFDNYVFRQVSGDINFKVTPDFAREHYNGIQKGIFKLLPPYQPPK